MTEVTRADISAAFKAAGAVQGDTVTLRQGETRLRIRVAWGVHGE